MKQARNEFWAIFLVVITWVAMVTLTGLGGDYPLNDDWAYAHSAKLFLHSGRMRILDWAAPSLIAHVAFGAGLMRIFGESHVVLRGGTVTLGLVALLLTYGLSRLAGLLPRRALLPPLALAVSPWFCNLALTYMSDVPWLAVLLAALTLCASALRPAQSPRLERLFLAGVLIGVAALIRQFAVVTLPAFVLVLLVDARRRLPGRQALLREGLRTASWLALPVVGIYAYYHHWYTHVHIPTMAHRETWRQMSAVDPLTVIRHVLAIAHYFGLWLLPLALALRAPFARPRYHRLALLTGIALTLFSTAEAVRTVFSEPRVWGPGSTIKPTMPYLGNIFYLVGLGPPTLYPTYSGFSPGIHTSPFFGALLTLLSLLGAVLASPLIAQALESLRDTLRGKQTVATVASSAELAPRAIAAEVRLLIGLSGAFYLGWHLCTGPFLFDRYILPLLPLSYILAVAEISMPLRRWPLFVLFVAGALLSTAGTREYLSWNAARADAVRELLAQGIPTSQIDAGFEWNGTWRFEDYVRRRGTIRHSDSSWWSVDLPYRLTFGPEKGCTPVRRYPFWTWPGGGEPAIYVLRCAPTEAP